MKIFVSIFFILLIIVGAYGYLNRDTLDLLPIAKDDAGLSANEGSDYSEPESVYNSDKATSSWEYKFLSTTTGSFGKENPYDYSNERVNTKIASNIKSTNPINVIWNTIVGSKVKEDNSSASNLSDIQANGDKTFSVGGLFHAPIIGGGGGGTSSNITTSAVSTVPLSGGVVNLKLEAGVFDDTDTVIQGCIPVGEKQDWITGTGTGHWILKSYRPIYPTECSVLSYNPPMFMWPDMAFVRHKTKDQIKYTLTLKLPSGEIRTKTLYNNWAPWDSALPSGEYEWKVAYQDLTVSTEHDESVWRRFKISSSAEIISIPVVSSMYNSAINSSRPRSFPKGAERSEMERELLSSRKAIFDRYTSWVNGYIGKSMDLEPTVRLDSYSPGSSERANLLLTQNTTINQATNLIMFFAFGYQMTGRADYLSEVKRRALYLASWDTDGTTSTALNSSGSRTITYTLSLTYDWCYSSFTESERAILLNSIKIRAGELSSGLVARNIDVMPYDSQWFTNLARSSTISLIMAGEAPEFEDYFNKSVPLFMNLLSPWGGDDGGYAQGGSYAIWDSVDFVGDVDTLRWSTGIDLWKKSFMKNFANYLVYFIPPNTPSLQFGDGAGSINEADFYRYREMVSSRSDSQLSRWYSNNIVYDPADYWINVLMSPSVNGISSYPSGTSNSLVNVSTGMSAMHSSLSDPNRISVYFRSSPYGSFSHAHADQNSFNINSGGKELVIDSGYYDWFGSPHYNLWYKTTKAHNAVTYDGGLGQTTGQMETYGHLVSFKKTDDVEAIMGDAKLAYGGALSKALRTLIYIRPDTIIVFDDLGSDTAKSFEWNIHAVNKISELGGNKIRIDNGGESLCVDFNTTSPVSFSETSAFTANPDRSTKYPRVDEWHGRFSMNDKSTSVNFVAVMSVGCKLDSVSSSYSEASGWTVDLPGKTVIFDGYNLTVK